MAARRGTNPLLCCGSSILPWAWAVPQLPSVREHRGAQPCSHDLDGLPGLGRSWKPSARGLWASMAMHTLLESAGCAMATP